MSLHLKQWLFSLSYYWTLGGTEAATSAEDNKSLTGLGFYFTRSYLTASLMFSGGPTLIPV